MQGTALAFILALPGQALAAQEGDIILLAQVEGPQRYAYPAAAQTDFYTETVPVTANDVQIGTINALVTLSGYAKVLTSDLEALLGARLKSEQKALLASYGDEPVLLEDLRNRGFLAIYDPYTAAIKISLQLTELRKNETPPRVPSTLQPLERATDITRDPEINTAMTAPPVQSPASGKTNIVKDVDPIKKPPPPAKPQVPKTAKPPIKKERPDEQKFETEKAVIRKERREDVTQLDKASEEYFPLEVPLLVNGAFVGDITAEATISGSAKLFPARLLELLNDRLGDADRMTLTEYGSAAVAVSQLQSDGFRLEYDAGELVVNMILALDGVQQVSVTQRSLENLNLSEYEEPAGISAGLSVIARPRYIHKSLNTKPGFAPLSADARGFVSMGGFKNWALVYELDALEGRDQLIRRDDVTLIHDNFRKALRFQAGDIRPSITGFQSGFQLLGIGVERNYGAIQPFRNLRPGGRTTFTLERSAQVTYEVNGVVIGDDRLAPGDYDIRDLPLATGANDVRVIIDDEFGTREVGTYSTFVDTELLSAKTLIFGANVGVRRESGYNGFNPNYGNDLLGTAFIEKGLSDNLTLGAQAEASNEGGFVGTRAVTGFGSNLLAAEAGFSAFDRLDTGYTAALRFTHRPFRETGKFYNEFDIQASYQSEDFKTVGNIGPPRGKRWQLAARNNTTFDDYSINVNGNWVKTDFDELTTVGATISTYVKNLNVSAGYQGQYSKLTDDLDNRFFVTLSKNFGRHGTIRSRTATGPYETELEWRRLSTRGVGAVSGRASYLSGELGDEFSADASYIASRAEFDISHTSTFENGFGRTETSVTDARIGVGLGLADGTLGFGRPVSDGFVLVKAHPSLEGRTIKTSQGAGRVSGKTGFIGPTIVPLSGPYREQIHRINVEDLPPGYDIGASQIKLFPSNFAGYKVRVGTDPSALVIGYLKKPDNDPVALAVGKLIAVDNAEVSPIDFFTNRTGRFVAERVPAGKYRLVLMPNETAIAILDIGEGTDGVEKVGNITVKEP